MTEMTEAIVSEEAIGEEAAEIRGEAPVLTKELLLALWPLLKRPIPAAFIQSIEPTKGKPYPSTGIRSVQVQIDRMNNVLTPLWWKDEVHYMEGGKLAQVTVTVGDGFVQRSSWGGVGQGSTLGNIYKGSYTNAAKLAFARIGPGHEVYLGATDLDPDVSEALAASEGSEKASGMIGPEIAQKLVEHAWAAGEQERLRLAASRLVQKDVGDCSDQEKAKEALTGALSFEQAEKLDRWLSDQADRAEQKEDK